MAITSSDIDNQSFTVDRKGYSIEEVDIFLERVSKEIGILNRTIEELENKLKSPNVPSGVISNEETEKLRSTISSQNAEIEKLKKELSEKVEDGSAISKALIVAQRSADKIVEDANKKSKEIINNANDKADYIEKEADEQKKQIMAEIEKLQTERNASKKEYKSMLSEIIKSVQNRIKNLDDEIKNIPADNPSTTGNLKAVNKEEHKDNVKPIQNQQNIANPSVNLKSQKDFSGFGDTDFGGDKID